MAETKPPFRAEHVGSFPRPERLIAAREDFAANKISKDELRRIETECIADVVAMQERVGIGAVTDGEYRKSDWRDFMYEHCEGFGKERGETLFKFRLFDGSTWGGRGQVKIVGKLKRKSPISAEDFSLLKPMTQAPIKANVPAPSGTGFAGNEVDPKAYPDREELKRDVTKVYREEIADLASRGCTYLQIDEVATAVLCDPNNQAALRERGADPNRTVDAYLDAINDAIAERPANMTVAVHLCRGNRGHGMADGGYEPVAERLFGGLEVDGFFLEYDTPRAGDFRPLRFVPKGKRVVLGLVSTKLPEVESVDALRRRIDEAAKVVPLDQLALSPQCGFSSSVRRDHLPFDVVERKLARIVEVAHKVWGNA
jgi:5-methyltetrahydropteroyltriglutamate--homocysteine methyltransferase